MNSTADDIFKNVINEGRSFLMEDEAKDVVRIYGIKTPEYRLARDIDAAIRVAEEIGYPVAMKIVSPDIYHKTDVGGVRLNIRNRSEVVEAFKEIIDNVKNAIPNARIKGILVEKMAREGYEIIIGVLNDPQFGHVIMFGAGGIYTELYRDVAFRLSPLTYEDALDMVMETKAYKVLKGFRGPELDLDEVLSTILKVDKLIQDHPEIDEMDINPVRVYEKGSGLMALDVKIRIKPPQKGRVRTSGSSH